MKSVFGRKIGMTQLMNDKGEHTPVTLIEVAPNYVVQITANQDASTKTITIGVRTKKQASKPIMGILKKSGISEVLTKFKQLAADDDAKIGQKVDLSNFQVGDKVTVSGITKGKGFAGTIKRHGFHRGPASHGSDNVRQPGSIGAQQPQRVIKGKKMAGRMGHKVRTIKNLKIVELDAGKNLIAVGGSVPGPNKSWIDIKG